AVATGLASLGGDLYASYSGVYSQLALDGTLSLTGAMFSGPNGLVFDNSGQLLVSNDQSSGTQLYEMPGTILRGAGAPSRRYKDMTFAGGDLFGIGFNRLQQIDPLDGSTFNSTVLDRLGSYTGIAAIPAPGSLALLGLGGFFAAIRRRA
ncbi:PEP-CTERM sorting domain-containing protein, partial [Phycisphaeraceae bacterium AH-315-B13]|nr:PEP-CTERM sorting domain-containing protein [Phycisphaeraceae bacterium AH-315-B13]